MPNTVIFPFKRTETTLSGGDYRSKARSRDEWVPKQTVRIVKETDADEDLWLVETCTGERYTVPGDDMSPHPAARELNTEFMTRVMTEHGNGLMQAFVIEAVGKYAEMVREMPEDQRERMNAGMLPYAPWLDCAEAYLAALKERGA